MNGSFKLVSVENGYGLVVYPPSQGGIPANINDIIEYLNFNKVHYNLEVIKNCTMQASGQPALLGNGECPKCNETYKMKISEDLMEATAVFYPPSDTGAPMSLDEFMKDLKFRKITYGIKMEQLQNFFQEHVYCQELVVAVGKKPRHGCDGYITYHFNTDLHSEPKMNEDGSVDFFHLNNINHCKKGDVLATITPEDPGNEGTTITGVTIKPHEVKKVSIPFAKNVSLSQDRLQLLSDVDGHVMMVEGKIFVSNVYQVENVGIGTGNIDFEGSVQVNGNVLNGFRVKAGGNVEVKGVVEGAEIEAGGDIIIAMGVNGMGKGRLYAKGNVVSKFIENANVAAEGSVSTESILHSNVSAGTEIFVEGRKGFITGGHVTAAERIKVRTLGSNMGASTIVEVGVNPEIRRQYMEVQKKMLECQNAIKNAQPIILNFKEKKERGARFTQEQVEYVKSLTVLCEQKKNELLGYKDVYLELQQKFAEQNKAVVEVYGEVYPGTTIAIQDTSTTLQNICRYCKFYRDGGEIRLTSI